MIGIRNKQEIKEELVNDFIKISMGTYSSNFQNIPLILKFDFSNFFCSSIPCYHDKSILCRHCGASFNPYCVISEASINWVCSICGHINQLPLPSPISNETGYSLACKSVPYNNAVFDVISSMDDNVDKPIIVIAIHSSLINDFKNIIDEINDENKLFRYSLIVFDNFIQLFDFKTKSWKVIMDNNYFSPTLLENLIGDWNEIKKAIKSIRISISSFCNITNLLSFVKQFKLSKLVILLNSLPNNLMTKIDVTCSIAIIGKSKTSLFQYKVFNKCSLFHSESFDYKMMNFIQNEINTPFMYEPKIIFHTSKTVNINTFDFDIYSISLKNVNSVIEYMQFEIKFTAINGIKVQRYINLKIPISSSKKIYQSIAFPKHLLNIYSFSSFIIYKCYIASFEEPINKLKEIIFNLSSMYPMKELWPIFINSVLSSPIFNESINQIQSTLFFLLKLPVQFLFLYFLPVDYSDEKIHPSCTTPNSLSKGRATFNGIYILDDSILPQFLSLLHISNNSILPIYKVNELPNISYTNS